MFVLVTLPFVQYVYIGETMGYVVPHALGMARQGKWNARF